ncbi:unconventional myosin-XIX isoform X8 [Ursus arctos]|uniref:unconventional myosin-XIX isoform X8 n=1 Tax=Ursus arctos TaxID=9644 RepID=UPI0025481B05|nr:unconventional myosin-XIX isoform X8 [Ursus arctos]
MLQQVNGHSSDSSSQGGEPLREDLQEFLSGEAPLHQLDDLTKVNPVTLETGLLPASPSLSISSPAMQSFISAGAMALPTMRLKNFGHMTKLKPHIFTVGEQTYRNVKSLMEPVNQSIIVSGESGAGKTWTSRCLMKFYAVVATSPTSWESHKIAERIEQRILNSNPVMEAFGNACTLRNDNSSRFGKFIQLQLNRAQQMTGATVQTYLLEKTRVACQASSERNFHIFYQICKGASTDERLQWHLPEGAAFSWLPNPERTLEEDCFEVTREAMLHLGIDTPTQNNIFQVLAGLLHLGNVRFADSEDEAQPCQLRGDATCSIRTSALLLQLPEDPLLETLRIRTIRAGRQQQVFRKPCSRAECDTRRDCLAKLVYARLEQLCINYANEKLQQHFVAHYLRAQQEEYAVEGLEWSFVTYQDNQTCLDLIEGSPISICSLINEECRLNRPSSAAQLQTRIESALAGSPCLGHNKLSREPSFIVVHYAGPVQYHTAGLVEKNKDPVPPELTSLLQQSQDPLLKVMFPADPEEKAQEEPSGQSRAPVLTVVSKFKASLEQLLQVLHGTTPHYIRCIKPNSQGQAHTFLQEEVLSQLEACGLVETIHISAAGFPIRIPHRNFMERYELLRRLRAPTSSGPRSLPPAEGRSEWSPCTEAAALQPLLQDILHTLPALTQAAAILGDPAEATPAPVHCGRTKVFMTDSMLELLEHGRAQVLEQCARRIQGSWRRHWHRKQERQRRAAVLIQAATRSWFARRHVRRLHAAATVIKRAWRKWRIGMAFLASKELDGVEEKHLSQVPLPTGSFLLPQTQTSLLAAIIRLWPLGLVLANAAAGVRGFQRKLVVWACLQLRMGSPSSYTVQTAQEHAGVTSIRALPQGSVKFHCRKSPLPYADICPEPSPYSVTGFNQILLERDSLGHR